MKNMRRLLALLLCLSMVLPMAMTTGFAAEGPTEHQYVSYDFEGYSVDEVPDDKWVIATNKVNVGDTIDDSKNWVKIGSDPAEPGNQVLAVSATQSNVETFANLQLETPVVGPASISVRICFPSDIPNSSGVHLYGTTGGNTVTLPNSAVSLMTNGSKQLTHRPDNQNKVLAQAALQPGRWYTLTIRVDTVSQTYNVWMDGQKMLDTDVKFRHQEEATKSIDYIRVAAPKAYNGTIYADDIIIRPGPVAEISSLVLPQDQRVDQNASFASLNLPDTLKAVLDDNTYVEIPVAWNQSGYDGSTEGIKIITGTLDPVVMGGNYALGHGVSVTAKVTVGSEDVKPDIKAVETLKNIYVETGTPAEKLNLPATVKVILSDNTEQDLAVTWDTAAFNGDVDGSYTLPGTLTVPDGMTNTGNRAASITVRVGTTQVFDFEDETVGSLSPDWTVYTLAGGMPDKNWARTIVDPADSGNQLLEVNATQDNIDTHATHAIETIDGEAYVSLRIRFPNSIPKSAGIHMYNASAPVATATNAVISIMNSAKAENTLGCRDGDAPSEDRALAAIRPNTWYDLGIRVDLTSSPRTFSVWLDGEKLSYGGSDTHKIRNDFSSIGSIRVAAPKGYNGTIWTDEIAVYQGPAVEIASVAPVGDKSVAFGTEFAALALPETLTAELEDGKKVSIPVRWDQSSYNPGQDGAQTVTGTLIPGGLYTIADAAVSVQVTVAPDATVRNVEALVQPEAIFVAQGAALETVLSGLPATVNANLTGGVTKAVAVTGWACAAYDASVNGEYVFEGTLVPTATITNTKNLKATIHVWVGMDEFDMLRQRWYYQIAGTNDVDWSDPDIADYADHLDERADEIVTKLVPVNGNTYQNYYDAFMAAHKVFTDYPMTAQNKTGTSQRTLTYDRLKSLALAYRTSQCKLFDDHATRDLILAAMDYMYADNRYSPTSGTFGNWYDWEIGTPLRFLDLMILMYDDLTTDQLEKFTASVDHYSPTANNRTGANRIWKCSVVAENAILRKDGVKLATVAPAAKNDLKYVTSSDGYYADGSYIQHESYAYTGGYGKALLVTLAPLMVVLDGTKYKLRYEDGAEELFFDAVFKTYEPVMINGAIMDMVRDREISRAGGQDHIPGRQAIRALLTLTNVMEGEKKARTLEMVKYFLEEDEYKRVYSDRDGDGFFLEYYVSLSHILKGKEIMKDAAIQARGPLTGYYNFADMAQVVQRNGEYAVGISMHGGNVKTYETTNDEGKNMWHTDDGAFYLYTPEKDKYAANYWGSVDHQRLPGTTVDRYNKASNFQVTKSNAAGALYGGAQIFDAYGATAFTVNNGVSSKKSYFLFDDEAVLLGSDITSNSGNPSETIVENYKANLDLSNKVSVDGQVQILGPESTVPDQVEYKVLEISSQTTGKNLTASKALPVQTSGTVELEYDAMFPNNADFLSVSLTHGGALVTQLILRSSKLGYRVSTSGSGQDGMADDQALTAGAWHHVKLEVDLDNQVAHYYLDGHQITAATNHITGAAVDLTNAALLKANAAIDGILLGTPNGGTGVGYYDNLTIKNGDSVLFGDNFDSGAEGQTPEGWSTAGSTDNSGTFQHAVITIQPPTPARSDDFAGKHEDVSYIHMQGNVPGADVGYVFPDGADVTGLRETRTQSWDLMNTYEKFQYSTPVTNSFITMYLEHGVNPDKASYEYIILPGKSEAQTAAYNAAPDVEILDNTETVHAVRENRLGLTAANFFAAGTSEGAKLSADKPASVMYGLDQDGHLTVSVADPTNKASGSITVTLDFPVDEVLTGDGKIAVERGEEQTVLTVDVTGSRGQTRTVTFDTPVSQGSSGGGSATETSKVSQPETADGVTAVTVTRTASGVGNTATVRYQDAELKKALDSAVKAAGQSGAQPNVTLEVKAPSAAGEIKSVVPTASVKAMAQAGASLTMNTPAAIVTWDAETLSGMAEAAKSGTITLTAARLDQKDLEDGWKNLLQGRPVVELKAESGVLSEFRGEALIRLPYSPAEGETSEALVVWYLAEDGKLQPIPCTYADGYVSFRSTHFSRYAVGHFPFDDVAGESWYYTDVVYAYNTGLMNGTGEGFTPDGLTTRGMVVTMLWRLAGAPETQPVSFGDVAKDSYCAQAVAWAVEQNIALGYGDGRFGPEEAVTREQLALLLQNYARLQGEDVSAPDRVSAFTDGAAVAPWAADAMNWCVEQGLLNGVGDNRLAPQSTAQRSQIAAIFHRMLERGEQ